MHKTKSKLNNLVEGNKDNIRPFSPVQKVEEVKYCGAIKDIVRITIKVERMRT
jgi:hypothetical protein